MKKIDLHVHTTASDGTFSGREAVQLAAGTGLAAIAVTDHDTVSGYAEAAQAGQELGGVEYQYTGLSAARDDEFGQKAAIVMPEGGAASFRAAGFIILSFIDKFYII